MMPKFDAGAIWSNFLGVNMSASERPTIFMGVPTMYAKLLADYDARFGDNPRMREYVRAVCSSKMR